MVIWEIENRGQRKFVIGLGEHLSGGIVQKGPNNEDINVVIDPGTIAKITEKCGRNLSEGWKDEIKVIRKINRKE